MGMNSFILIFLINAIKFQPPPLPCLVNPFKTISKKLTFIPISSHPYVITVFKSCKSISGMVAVNNYNAEHPSQDKYLIH